ncbi:MAG: MBL fold metallo-hydrolase [Myxococcota bacterium]
MIFRQLFDSTSSTYTYLLADEQSREAVLVDTVREQEPRDTKPRESSGSSEVHARHPRPRRPRHQRWRLEDQLGAQTVVSARGGAVCADRLVDDGDRLAFGRYTVEVVATPGHTSGCVTYVVRDGDRVLAFTGDTLLVRGCGRTDFQQGDAHALFHSVRDKLFALPDHTLVYPGHDYRGNTVTTIGEEKQHNPRLNLSIDEDRFVEIMGALNLANPKLMDVAVPANLACGQPAT